MELQDLIIIFLIIIIPIILIFSYYLNLQSNTIKMQTDYDEKLIEATKEAVEAFEINTTELNSEYNTLANLKRRDLLASINVFTTSLSSKLGIGGTAKENILNYVPAIVFTMYDGYYIYSPTHIPKSITNDNGIQMFYYRTATEQKNKFVTAATQRIGGYAVSGEPMYEYDNSKEGSFPESETYNGRYYTTDTSSAQTTYKHVLKTFVPYSTTIDNYTVNYTLGNYVRIYGYGTNKDISREGYIDSNASNFATKKSSSSHIAIGNVDKETLTENIPVKISGEVIIKEYKYVFNTNTDKRYYDEEQNRFFITDGEYNIVYLPEVNSNNSLAEFKKVLIRDTTADTEYKELYQILNSGSGTGEWYIYIASEKKYEKFEGTGNDIPAIAIYEDCSGINYTVETACFNQWLKGKIDGESLLAQKREIIVNNINNNLNLSISNYSANSSINYKIPELTDLDWDQALSNISMIAFFQGMKIGLKTYNNYSIVTSTENNEFVNENSMYYPNYDDYYHIYPCAYVDGQIGHYGGYRNTEFKLKTYTKTTGETVYYYMHTKYTEPDETTKMQQPTYGTRKCFNCIVNRNNMETLGESDLEHTYWKEIHSTAVAREEYIQMCRTRLTNSNSILMNGTPEVIPDPEPTPSPEPEVCEHESVRYESIGNSEHKIICSNCGTVLGTEEHDVYYELTKTGIGLTAKYYHQRKCTKCSGYLGKKTKCTINISDWKKNNSQHWIECYICKGKINQANHIYNANICRVCGYKK